MNPETIGATVRAERARLGLTQDELSDKVSTHDEPCHRTWIARLEAGHPRLVLTVPRAQRLAAALNITLEELIGGGS